MSEIKELVAVVTQGEPEKIITVLTFLGGVAIVVWGYLHKVIYAQNLNEIEKVFMDRKQRTNVKLLEMSVVILVMLLLNAALMLIPDIEFNALLALASVLAVFLIFIYLIYKASYFIWHKLKKTDRKWKYDADMEQMVFTCETLIGVEVCKLTYINFNFIYGFLMCIGTTLTVMILLAISSKYFEDRTSKISYKDVHGKKMYIYCRLDENYLLCGHKPDIKKARIVLVPYEILKNETIELQVDWPSA